MAPEGRPDPGPGGPLKPNLVRDWQNEMITFEMDLDLEIAPILVGRTLQRLEAGHGLQRSNVTSGFPPGPNFKLDLGPGRTVTRSAFKFT